MTRTGCGSHGSARPAARIAGGQHAGPEIGSHSVTGRWPEPSTQVSAGYLQPGSGCHRCSHRGCFVCISCAVDALPEHCLCRRSGSDPLVAAVFRTNRLLRERCPATCQRRRRPGQVRRRQGRLQITAVRHDWRPSASGLDRHAERSILHWGGQGLARDERVGVACGQAASTSRDSAGVLIARSALPILRWESTFPGRLASYGHDGPCIPGWHGAAARSLSSCGEGSC